MKAHRTDRISLVFGLIFLAIVGSWTLARTVDIQMPAFGWFVAIGLIVFGVLGLVSSLRLGRRRAPSTSDSAGDRIPAEDLDATHDRDLAPVESADTDKS
jgi:hypothetical protein